MNHSLTDFDSDFKGADNDFYREMQRRMTPDYLETVSMTTLYDTDFEGQEPLIDGLLYRGAYLLAGSPKVGKSFLMAQLAYQVSTGLPLWGYKVRKTGVLYFSREDNYARLQRRLFRMFGAEAAKNLYFATHCKTANSGLLHLDCKPKPRTSDPASFEKSRTVKLKLSDSILHCARV